MEDEEIKNPEEKAENNELVMDTEKNDAETVTFAFKDIQMKDIKN